MMWLLSKKQQFLIIKQLKNLRVNFHDVENIKPRPINVVVRLRKASDKLVVAAFFIICVSSDSLLRSSPVRVTS